MVLPRHIQPLARGAQRCEALRGLANARLERSGVCGQLPCPLNPALSAASPGIIGRRGGGRGVSAGVCGGCAVVVGGDADDAVEGDVAVPPEPEAATVATTAVYASPSLLKAASASRA